LSTSNTNVRIHEVGFLLHVKVPLLCDGVTYGAGRLLNTKQFFISEYNEPKTFQFAANTGYDTRSYFLNFSKGSEQSIVSATPSDDGTTLDVTFNATEGVQFDITFEYRIYKI
jgi:hypothetical protein